MDMSTELKQELDEQLSLLVREYEDRGLSSDDIADSLEWHADLAESRSNEHQVVLSDG